MRAALSIIDAMKPGPRQRLAPEPGMCPAPAHLSMMTPAARVVISGLRPLVLLAVFAAAAAALRAADPVALLKDPAVQSLLDVARRNEPETIALHIKLTEIPAPPFKEQARAAVLKELFEQFGLKNVFIDKAGNVVGTRPGAQPRPNVVISAHLDTVFPEGTDVTVKRVGQTLRAPGIGDDSRGLAELVSVLRALQETKIPTTGTITFVATVGEEGLGDLRGVKMLFDETLKDRVDMFVSIDGGGVSGITAFGVGSYRYRVTFKGPGGHSYSSFGLVNPIHALGRAVDQIADIQVPASPKTTFNVGRIGGGTSVNSIAFEAWMEIDMRSPDLVSLNGVRAKILAAIDTAVKDENARWQKGAITADVQLVGDRPPGQTSADTTLVQSAQAVVRALGAQPTLNANSTDANYPMKLGIPAITIGTGGIARDAHSLDESYEPVDSWKGPQHTLLLLLSLTR
jgi:acetylornithine deacetylase/succinyl-diaminopimelate desuccinylase-like protein